MSRITTKTGREVSKRTLNLMDTSGKAVAVALWGEEVIIKAALSVCLRSVSAVSLYLATYAVEHRTQMEQAVLNWCLKVPVHVGACVRNRPQCVLSAHTAVGFSALIGIGQIIPVTLSNVLEQSPLISDEKAK